VGAGASTARGEVSLIDAGEVGDGVSCVAGGFALVELHVCAGNDEVAILSNLRSCTVDASELELARSRPCTSADCCNEAEVMPGKASDSKYVFEEDHIVFI
jgi:hypothetical protein